MTNRGIRNWVLILIAAGLTVWLSPRSFHKPASSDDANNTEAKAEEEEEELEHIKVSRDDLDRTVVAINVETQSRLGLVTAPLPGGTYQPFVKAWGQLEEDPARTFTLRSPVPGFLVVHNSAHWPHVGEHIKPGTVLGELGPRLSLVERYDLTTKVLQSRAEVDELEADLAAARSSYESKKQLNVDQNVVAKRTLEEAEAKVKSTEARVASAKQIVQLLQDALAGKQAVSTTISLIIERAGDVVEVTAQPGEAVESGQALIKLIDPSGLVARVATSAGSHIIPTPQKARLQVMGVESRVFEGTLLGPIPATAASRGQSFMISIENTDSLLRPGSMVEATLELPGEPTHGVIAPAGAVIRLGGSAYVYVQTAEERYTRVAIKTDAPAPDGWFVTVGLTDKDRVVVTGAGTLLSEELRSQIEAEAGGESDEKDKEAEKEKD